MNPVSEDPGTVQGFVLGFDANAPFLSRRGDAWAMLMGRSRRFIPRIRRSTAWRTGRPITRPLFDAVM